MDLHQILSLDANVEAKHLKDLYQHNDRAGFQNEITDLRTQNPGEYRNVINAMRNSGNAETYLPNADHIINSMHVHEARAEGTGFESVGNGYPGNADVPGPNNVPVTSLPRNMINKNATSPRFFPVRPG